ncbi:DUF2239 family protein [Consotaella aegiceratis]|uniref:DUF2239 family protein n=1 Tax=Consotaella aegiceratis TaxID=3097961 RepID=UPI002F4021C8
MPSSQPSSFTAFAGRRQIGQGALAQVALVVKGASDDPDEPILVFDDTTGRVVDLDLRGSPEEIAARHAGRSAAIEPSGNGEPSGRGRGRPKLGVVAREVTLLPRHWDWLAAQPGGASQALRRLVDQARRADGDETRKRMAREAAYRVMSSMAGDFPGFEEASRALFAGDRKRFAGEIARWPEDIAAYALRLAETALKNDGDTATP